MARFVYFCRREMFVVDFKIPYFRFLLCVDIMRGSYVVLCYLQPPLVKVQFFLNPRIFEIQIRYGYKYLGSDVRKSISYLTGDRRQLPCETTATRKVTVKPLIHTTVGTIFDNCFTNLYFASSHYRLIYPCW